jgi:hypothetical protein
MDMGVGGYYSIMVFIAECPCVLSACDYCAV